MAQNPSTAKSVVVGALAGAAVFLALSAVKAQTSLTVFDFQRNSKQYVGTEVRVTGLAQNIRHDVKQVQGKPVEYTKLNLYSILPNGKRDSHYIYVNLPTSSFRFVPNEGDSVSIQGTPKWPYEIAVIDQ